MFSELSRRAFFLLFLGILPGAAQAPSLSITQPAVHSYEDGPILSESYRFSAGDRVFVSFRIAGFQVTPGDEDRRVRLTYALTALDSDGAPLESPLTGKVDTTLAREDKEWTPKIRAALFVPQLASPGLYRVRIDVKDELAGSATLQELPFRLQGRTVEPSATLAIRNFRFLRGTEDAPTGLDPPSYRPGAPVYARFEITGYKFGPRNGLSVAYGIEVLKPGGERIFAEPQAAHEQQESFYPKRYIEGSLQLSFEPALNKGEYIVVVTVRDVLHNDTFQSRYSFSIE